MRNYQRHRHKRARHDAELSGKVWSLMERNARNKAASQARLIASGQKKMGSGRTFSPALSLHNRPSIKVFSICKDSPQRPTKQHPDQSNSPRSEVRTLQDDKDDTAHRPVCKPSHRNLGAALPIEDVRARKLYLAHQPSTMARWME